MRQDLYPNDDAIDERASGYYNPGGSEHGGDSSGKAETNTTPATGDTSVSVSNQGRGNSA